jgi:hypothetical protein
MKEWIKPVLKGNEGEVVQALCKNVCTVNFAYLSGGRSSLEEEEFFLDSSSLLDISKYKYKDKYKMKQILLISLLLFSGFKSASAQNVELKGLVREAQGNEALVFVNAMLQTPDSAFVTGTIPDDNGRFVLPNIQPGNCRQALSCIGYINPESLCRFMSNKQRI